MKNALIFQKFYLLKKIELKLNVLNTKLKKCIRILDAEEVDEKFHSRYNCKKKTYRYIINNSKNGTAIYRNLEYNFNEKLDIKKMDEAVKNFIGEHDFLSFSRYFDKKPTIKTIYEAKINRLPDDTLEIVFVGNGFLKYMVRIMVGTLIDIGLGKKKSEDINRIFSLKDRRESSKTASPNGLFLYKVWYKEE